MTRWSTCRRAGYVALRLALVTSAGCSDESITAQRPPSSGLNADSDASLSPPTSMADAGMSVAARTRCDNVVAASEPGEGVVNTSVQSPVDFAVTRVAMTITENCSKPQVVLALSDGRCPLGKGHQLTLSLDARAIATQAIVGGENDVLTAHGEGLLDVLYERSSAVGDPGTFGTCNVGTGTIALTAAPQLTRGATYEGSYQLSLSPCVGTPGPVQSVYGTFSATLPAGIEVLCPGFRP